MCSIEYSFASFVLDWYLYVAVVYEELLSAFCSDVVVVYFYLYVHCLFVYFTAVGVVFYSYLCGYFSYGFAAFDVLRR